MVLFLNRFGVTSPDFMPDRADGVVTCNVFLETRL